MPKPPLHFNGIDAERGGYFEPPMAEADVLHRLAGRLPAPDAITGVRLDVCPDSLAEAGWGIVWPGEVDPEIEQALAPLLDLRRAQTAEAGPGRFFSFHYRGETGEAFLSQHGASLGGTVKPETFPYYLLLVGEPSEIPFNFQHRLGQSHLVGRLCFDAPEAYGWYAANAVTAERGDFVRPKRAVVFGVHHPDDPPTDSSLAHLVRPVGTDLTAVEDWQVEQVLAGDATKRRLQTLLGGEDTPLLLFTAGHALWYKAKSRFLLARQGGLLCSDWPGPVEWGGPNPPEHYLVAEDIPDDADLRGLISIHFGCFTAGTPRRDLFPEFVDGRPGEGQVLAPEPFIAALPKRLLGHPRGALASIGHVDRAWPHSFFWGALPGQTAAFESALRGLMAGLRVGRAMAPFAERRSTVSEEVMNFWLRGLRSGEEAHRDEAELWIRYHDARNYVLLGDPAARLPAA